MINGCDSYAKLFVCLFVSDGGLGGWVCGCIQGMYLRALII